MGAAKGDLDVLSPIPIAASARYWNRFSAKLSVPTIYFEDYPGLDQVDAPDGSHLDAHDIALFTECPVDAMVDKGLVDRARPSRCRLRKP